MTQHRAMNPRGGSHPGSRLSLTRRRRGLGAFIAGLLLTVPFGATALAQEPLGQGSSLQSGTEQIEFNIPSQSLTSALNAFGEKTGLQVSFPAEIAAGLTSPGASGLYTPEAALQRLLEGTGLTYRIVDGRTLTLQKATEEPSAPVATSEAPPGQAESTPTMQAQAGFKPIKVEEIVIKGAKDRHYVPEDNTTATRTPTPLRDVPQSVEVVTREVMDDQKVIRLEQAVRNVSGLFQGSTSGNRFDNFICRGFPCGFFKNYLRNDSITQVRTFRESANLERIEILKGPPSVLYGRSEPGGILNLLTKSPLPNPYYSAETIFGSYGLYRDILDVSGPLNEDKTVLYRATGLVENSESYRDFVFGQRYFVSPVFTWRLGSRTSLRLEGEYIKDRRTFDRGLVAIGERTAPVPISRFLQEPFAVNKVEEGRAGFIVTHEFNPDWSLFSGFRADMTSDEGTEMFPRLVLADRRTLRRRYQKQANEGFSSYWRNDLIGNFTTGPIGHTLLTGFEIGRENGYFEFGSGGNSDIDIYNPTYGTFQVVPVPLNTIIKFRLSSFGGYMQDQVTLLENLKLLAGFRYDIFHVDQEANGTITKQENMAVSPRIGLVYQPVEPISLYANYTQAFLPQVAQTCFTTCFQKDGSLPDPERGTQYEAGAKTTVVPDRLFATLAFYRIVKKNVLAPDPSDPFFSVVTGEQRSQGIELDVTANLRPGWNVIGSYAYTDARIIQSVDFASGNRLQNVGLNSGSLWTTYEIQGGTFKGVGAGVGVFATGQRAGDNSNSFYLPGYVRADAALYYRKPNIFNGTNLITSLNFYNLLDQQYYNAAQSRLIVYPGAPLTLIGSMKLEFF